MSGEGGACTREAGQARGGSRPERGGVSADLGSSYGLPALALQGRLVVFPPGFPPPRVAGGAQPREGWSVFSSPRRQALLAHSHSPSFAYTPPLTVLGVALRWESASLSRVPIPFRR